MTKRQWFFSFFIVVFLFFATILPNGMSYFHHTWKTWLIPAANTLNVGYAWQFFSPDPAAAIYYEYELLQDNTVLDTVVFPSEKRPFLFRPNYSRRTTLKNIFFKFPDLNYDLFVPYMCRQNKNANYIHITKITIKPLSFAEARSGVKMQDDTYKIKEDLGYEACQHDS